MKVNKIFHWLYFLMLLLPIFAIPIYALYMTNKNATFTQQITVNENKVVDFNQLVANGKPNDLNTYTLTDSDSGSLVYNDNAIQFNLVNYYGDYRNGFGNYFYDGNGIYVVANHKYLSCYTAMANEVSYIYCAGDAGVSYGVNSRLLLSTNYQTLQFIFTPDTSMFGNRYFYVQKYSADLSSDYYCRVKFNMLIDLTQMFGSGNEPTIQQFNQWYSNEYYNYTLSQKQLLKDYDQTTYTDTDVGSQFTYMLYNSVDKYFNYDNVFNFGSLYDYLQLNFFNGNAPIGFFIFWHYLIYFLLTSLLWLLFDVLMYVPNLIHRWIDKAEL